MNPSLPWVLVLGRLGALALLAPAYAAFSDDCATRLLLAEEWARSPFLSAQIPWLPLPMVLVGGLIRLTGLDALSCGVGINILLTSLLPIFLRPLLEILPPARQAWALLLAATLPWAVYPGVSGLSEPIFWALSLGVVAAYLKDSAGLLVASSALVCLTRYEGWILVMVFGGAFLIRRHRQGKSWKPSAVLLSITPLLWLAHQMMSGHLLLAFTVPMKDAAAAMEGGGIPRPLAFFALALMAAPLWFLLFPFIRRRLGTVPRASWIFIFLLYMVTTLSGLGTALGQRNLVLPLLLLLPALVARSPRAILGLIVVVQMAALFNPERALNAPLQDERAYAAACVNEARSVFGLSAPVVIGQGAPGHAYLARHVALRAELAPAFPELWVDQISPSDKIRGETREKHMPFESFSAGPEPLISFWRSHKIEHALAGLEPAHRERVLRAHDIRMILIPRAESWPRRHGFVRVGGSQVHGVWIRESEEGLSLRLPVPPAETNTRVPLREALRRLQEDPFRRESLDVLWQVFLW